MSWRPPEPDPFVDVLDAGALQDAVAARSRERECRDRAADLATWTGTLRDLAERGRHLVVRTAGDRVHRGALVAVGIDHVAVRLPDFTTVLIASDTLRSVRPEPGSVTPVASGDRERSQNRTLAEALVNVVEDRPDVVLLLRDTADPVAGTIIGSGEDIVTMRMSDGGRGVMYLPLAAVREVAVHP